MNEPDTLDEDKERELQEQQTPLKTAHLAANSLRDMAALSSSLSGVTQALLAIERRVYWHGLIMQQRP